MALSVFDLFSIGLGPSSSHMVGPMRAARRFVLGLQADGLLHLVVEVTAELYGSLALTGLGHGTDRAILLGLEGAEPDKVEPDSIPGRLRDLRSAGVLRLLGRHDVAFDEAQHLRFHRRESLAYHANGMRFTARAGDGAVLSARVYYSVGGGFVVTEEEAEAGTMPEPAGEVPYPFHSAEELLRRCSEVGGGISDVVMANEQARRSETEVRLGLRRIWEAMQACVRAGCSHEGALPGGLGVLRRAPALHRELTCRPEASLRDPLTVLDWVNLYALAVNEENAAGGRVVTAPTNGAAGIMPAVLHYYDRFCSGAGDEGLLRFFLTAGAMGMLFKENASISGAEVGCQGEVGVACSMAAAGLTEALGGSPAQVENAAEIAMEHNLGLTCDPVGGLVQIPCIERNAMGAVKAINASRLALRGDGSHRVSLDTVIATMRQTGADMQTKYKETSQGGLAVNVIEC